MFLRTQGSAHAANKLHKKPSFNFYTYTLVVKLASLTYSSLTLPNLLLFQLVNAIELKDPKCHLCKKTPVIKQSSHIFLELDKLQVN